MAQAFLPHSSCTSNSLANILKTLMQPIYLRRRDPSFAKSIIQAQACPPSPFALKNKSESRELTQDKKWKKPFPPFPRSFPRWLVHLTGPARPVSQFRCGSCVHLYRGGEGKRLLETRNAGPWPGIYPPPSLQVERWPSRVNAVFITSFPM